MDWNEILLTVGLTMLGFAMAWLRKQKFADDALREVFLTMEGSAQAAKDSYMAALDLAKRPESDGGVEVTEEEKKQARKTAYNILLRNLSPAAMKYLGTKSEDLIEGWIGKYLDKVLGTGPVAPAKTSVKA